MKSIQWLIVAAVTSLLSYGHLYIVILQQDPVECPTTAGHVGWQPLRVQAEGSVQSLATSPEPIVEKAASPVVVQAAPNPPGDETTEGNRSNDNSRLLMEQTVRLLFQDPQRAEEYLREHPWDNFSFYVYDNLPEAYTWEANAACVEKHRQLPHECDWGESICGQDVPVPTKRNYASSRMNRNADLILAKVLAQYNGTLRTYDPAQATLFVVPYASQAHVHCHRVSEQELQSQFLDQLQYLNETTQHKHLFLASAVFWRARKELFRYPLLATVSDVGRWCEKVGDCGKMVIPYANTNPEYQPNVVGTQDLSVQDRNFSLVAKYSQQISGSSYIRVAFMQEAQRYEKEVSPLLAGKPMSVGGLSGKGRSMGGEREILSMYRDTVFCPILRGDDPVQKRPYDAWLSGCIPVVLKYNSTEEDFPSYYARNAVSIRHTYPFSVGSFYGVPDMGLPYRDMVVEIDAHECGDEHGIVCMLHTLERLLEQEPERLTKIKETIRRVVPLLSYGMEQNALQYPDVVSAILVKARHYIEHLQPSDMAPPKKKRYRKRKAAA